jgi:hypothetical protein
MKAESRKQATGESREAVWERMKGEGGRMKKEKGIKFEG